MKTGNKQCDDEYTWGMYTHTHTRIANINLILILKVTKVLRWGMQKKS